MKRENKIKSTINDLDIVLLPKSFSKWVQSILVNLSTIINITLYFLPNSNFIIKSAI